MDRADQQPVSRRTFGVLTAAAGVAAAGSAAAQAVTERDVEIKTADGTVDAVLFAPAKGSAPGVLIWPDALGLRPEFRGMGRRLAGDGYTVLVPNPFYRTRKAPVIEGPFDFSNPADRAKLGELRAPLTPEAVSRDAVALIAFLDAQPATDKRKKVGVQGYCMGGPMTFQSAAAVPNRVGAGASFHGGGLVTDRPDSPHLLIPKMRSEMLVAVADNDDQRQPEAKTVLKDAFAAANRPAKVEVYTGAQHGWCVPGSAVYAEAPAEKAWAELLAMYKRALV